MVGAIRFWFFSLFLITYAFAQPGQDELRAWYAQIEAQSPGGKQGLTAPERQRVMNLTSRHPIASLDAVDKYDPEGDIGFCFGRALTAQVFARKLGLDGEHIRKLFIVGDLRSGPDPEWRFHVTTLVRGDDGGWYAIDPILAALGKVVPVPAAEWIRFVQSRWDKQKQANLFLAHRDTQMPDTRLFPAQENETGEKLVEVSFVPAGKPGFTALTMGAATVYDVDLQRQDQHFLRYEEPIPEDRFSFVRLDILILKGTQKIPRAFDFRNYFVDLLADLKVPGVHGDERPLELEMDQEEGAPDLRGFRVRGE